MESTESFGTIRPLLRKLPLVLAVGIAVNLIVVRWLRGDGSLDPLGSFSWPWLTAAILLVFVPWIIRSCRNMIWARTLGVPLSFLESLRVVLFSEVAAAVTPTAVGGAPAAMALLYRAGFRAGSAMTLTLIGTFEDGLFFLLAIGGILWSGRLAPFFELTPIEAPWAAWDPRWIAGWVFVALAILLIAVRSRGTGLASRLSNWGARVRDVLVQARFAFVEARRSWRLLLVTLPMTAIQWSARYSIVILLARGLGLDVDALTLFVLQCATFTVMSWIPLPGATGGAEGAFLLLHRGLIPEADVPVLMAGWRTLTFLVPASVSALLIAGIESRFAPRIPTTVGQRSEHLRDPG